MFNSFKQIGLLNFPCREAKTRNRPSFKQVLMHLEIATPELLKYSYQDFITAQVMYIYYNKLTSHILPKATSFLTVLILLIVRVISLINIRENFGMIYQEVKIIAFVFISLKYNVKTLAQQSSHKLMFTPQQPLDFTQNIFSE
jgi:hypothetical protein